METKENKLPAKTLKLASKAFALSLVANSESADEDEALVLANIARDEAVKTFFKLFPGEKILPFTPAGCIELAQKYTKSVKDKK
ncbi:MAG: hypothetical protein PHE67_00425 [Campylobacterales bacterium]|nr:hypothetical protein [Campylobacterales bacterium]